MIFTSDVLNLVTIINLFFVFVTTFWKIFFVPEQKYENLRKISAMIKKGIAKF